MKWLNRGRNDGQNQRISQIRTIHRSAFLIEYRGAIACAPNVPFTIICSEIKDKHRSALLAEGFKPIEGAIPTHGIFCTFKLLRDSGNPRCLFNLYLDLSDYSAPWQIWISAKITKGLKRSLTGLTTASFAVRCADSEEFPFCLDDKSLDEYWLLDAMVYLRSAMRDVAAFKRVD